MELNLLLINTRLGLSWWLSGKETACQCRRHGFDPWVGKILWSRKWWLTPVFLPGKSHRERSLAGYSPWGCKRIGHKWVNKQQHPTSSYYFQALEHFSLDLFKFSSVQFSHSVMSDSLWPHESQHARPPCPSPSPRVHPNSHPSS